MAVNRRVSTFLLLLNLSLQLPLVNHSKGLLLQVSLQLPQDISNWRPLTALPYYFFRHTFWVFLLKNV